MNNKLEVIGIDHGWSMMKTVTQVFVTGVKEITTTPALFGDVLEYDGKGKAYVHKTQGADRIIGPPFEILSEKAIKHYEKMKDKGENVYIDTLTYEQFMLLGDKELSRRFWIVNTFSDKFF